MGLRHFFLALAIAALLSSCVTRQVDRFNDRATCSSPDKILVFMGEKIFVRKHPLVLLDDIVSTENGSIYEARFRVMEVLHGQHQNETVDFTIVSHSDLFDFTTIKTALIYLEERQDRLQLINYEIDELFPTADGRLAGCGNPYVGLDAPTDVEEYPVEKIDFEPPVVKTISDWLIPPSEYEDYAGAEIEENRDEVAAFFSEPYFEISGDKATCKMGAYAQQLFRIRYLTVLRSSIRREACMEPLAAEARENSYFDIDWDALGRCIAQMEQDGIPRLPWDEEN